MIHAIQSIGQELLYGQEQDPVLLLTQEPNAGGNYPAMLMVELKSDPDNLYEWNFTGVTSEETKFGDKSSLYLYRRRGANGANYSPTALITDLEKTWNTRVLSWFSYVGSMKSHLSESTMAFFQSVDSALQKNTVEIITACRWHQETSKHSFGISIKLDSKYLGEYAEFYAAFQQLVQAKDLEVYAEEKHCSVCGADGVNVIGNLNVFKFYTLDKPGYISGKFQASHAWRNYPVCFSCKSQIEAGKAYLQKNLSFNFYGLSYLIVPKWLFPSEESGYILNNIGQWQHKQKISDPDLYNRLTRDEREILEILSEETNQLQFDFLFLKIEQSGAVERVLLHLEDIHTNRLRQLFEAKREVERKFELKQHDLFHFGRIRTFFSKSSSDKKNYDLDKYFLMIVNHIFTRKEIDFTFLIHHFMREIRSRLYDEKQPVYYVIRDAALILHYFRHIGILPWKEGQRMREDAYTEVIRKYGTKLDQPVKEGLFLLGALTQILLDIQRRNRNATPFEKQLKGLRMNRTELMRLLNKTVDKLRAYNEYGSRMEELVAAISARLLDSNGSWKMSVDEMNFYVATGMALKSEINAVRYRKEDKLA